MQELRELPARVAGVELQVLQLREEMQVAFSALRSELHEEVGGLRGEMHGIRDDLREETRAGNQATRDSMRALYEDALTRMATIGEGKKGRKR